MEIDIEAYIAFLQKSIMDRPRVKVEVSLDWAVSFEDADAPGVYIFFEHGRICYVGETGNIQARLQDFLETRHHSFRRSLGKHLFKDHDEFYPASTSQKFATSIENLLNDWIESHLQLAYLPVRLGRKELEEKICGIDQIITAHNKKTQRKSKGKYRRTIR